MQMPSSPPPEAERPALTCSKCTFDVTVRCRKVKVMGKKLAWCSGACARGSGNLRRGEQVDVLLHSDAVGPLPALMHAFSKDRGRQQGGSVLVNLSCEQPEQEERNHRGAVVLRAVRYLDACHLSASSSEDDEDDGAHGPPDEKSARHSVFADFLFEQFGEELLSSGAGVLDVAAGSGALSAELCVRAAALRCTLVEPAVRDAPRSPPGCRFLAECFDDADFAARHEALLRDCSILVGCHPDQCTESIVDVALARGKPFAVIPCCVFPTLFPARRIGTGQSVRTYRGFLKYLREKHPGVLTARLGFEGRNRVLFYRGGAPEPAHMSGQDQAQSLAP